MAFGSSMETTNSTLFFFSVLILFEFIPRLGTTQLVTVHCLADTSLKIVPTNPQVPTEKYYTLPGIDSQIDSVQMDIEIMSSK